MAQVYKTTDADGNVVFTDQPPDNNAQPMDLPELSVISPAEPPDLPEQAQAVDGQADAKPVTDLRELRRGFRDFAISQPQADETFWGTENRVAASWTTRYALQEGMQVTFVVNGASRVPTTAETIVLDGLDRGEHTVFAELRDTRKRLIARSSEVTFHVKQNSANFNQRPIAIPHRGGG
jgi:hypothetical protein